MGEGVAKGKGGQIYDDRRRFDLGGKHTTQYTDDILQNCTIETCITL